MATMKPTLRFARALVGTSVRSAMAERGAFIMRVVLMAVNNAIFFTFWIVLLSRVPRIRGYDAGRRGAAVRHRRRGERRCRRSSREALQHLARMIHDGELDALIAQPKPTLLYAVGLRSQPSGLGDVVSGLVMIALSGRVTHAGHSRRARGGHRGRRRPRGDRCVDAQRRVLARAHGVGEPSAV